MRGLVIVCNEMKYQISLIIMKSPFQPCLGITIYLEIVNFENNNNNAFNYLDWSFLVKLDSEEGIVEAF